MQTASCDHQHDDGYEDFSKLLQKHVAKAKGPVFTTDAEGLFERYLGALRADRRQHYNCRCCHQFVERFGGLVTLDEAGDQRPLVWSLDAPPFFVQAVRALDYVVTRAKVTGVFLSSEMTWGTVSNVSKKGVTWSHLHARQPESVVVPSSLLTCSQAMAAYREDHGTLCRGLADFPRDVAHEAHRLLAVGDLLRAEKCIGVARWLFDLHESLVVAMDRRRRDNLTWRAVALAPVGFAHIRSTMIGTLLEDIAAGLPFEDIRRRWNAKMGGDVYQRPQAAPTNGQLAAAESIIAKLASAGSLERRLATLEDIKGAEFWLPRDAANAKPSAGVFAHLRTDTRPAAHVDISTQVITWEKFARTVLPDADRIELLTPPSGPFFGFTTAANADAPPILQWDREGRRQPVSWYQYVRGSMPHQWGLTSGAHVDVVAITTQPNQWGAAMSHQGEGIFFVLRGAKDTRNESLALFPEHLRSEYHGMRSAIEAFSASKSFPPCENPAAGICLQKGPHRWGYTLRVTSKGGRASYVVDRWD